MESPPRFVDKISTMVKSTLVASLYPNFPTKIKILHNPEFPCQHHSLSKLDMSYCSLLLRHNVMVSTSTELKKERKETGSKFLSDSNKNETFGSGKNAERIMSSI